MSPQLSRLMTLVPVPWFCPKRCWSMPWACMTTFILGEQGYLVSPWAGETLSPGNTEVLLSLPVQRSIFLPPETGVIEDFYCIWTEDIPNKLSSFNLLFQSFIYLLGYRRSSSYSMGQNELSKAFPWFYAKFYQFFYWRNHLSCLSNSIHSLRRDLWFS